ncbi:MAG: DUF4347 domain-containing protein, partial [Oculatellaceae cyanobacterium Prado106]|nr:DUF4347 domain-containing protein [Oculatellaceae cyanobacterium Prado106]
MNSQSNILVFIDPAVSACSDFVKGAWKYAQVTVLDPNQDGITQITQILTQSNFIDSIHIVSHGEPGTLHLGNTTVNGETLSKYRSQLQQWTQVSEILLYGCRVAAGEVGRSFVQKLHDWTGGAIAASTTLIGSTALGGNWDLDWQIGSISSPPAFSESALSYYPFTLNPSLPSLVYNIINGQIFIVNTNTPGNITPYNPLTGGTISNTLAFTTSQGAAQDPFGPNNLIYYLGDSSGANNRIGTWNPVTGAAIDLAPITGVGNPNLAGSNRMAFRANGELYVMRGTSLNIVSTGTGLGVGNSAPAGTVTATFTLSIPSGGDMVFDPTDPNTLYISTSTNDLYRVTFTGSTPTLPATLVGSMGVNLPGLAFGSDGQLYGISGGSGGRLYQINKITASLTNLGLISNGSNDLTSLPILTPGVILTPTTGLTTTELGGTASFWAVLRSQPTADVTLTFTSDDSTEGTVTSTVTFTPSNWRTPQIVTITGVDDPIVDGNIPYSITTTTSSTDINYSNLTVTPVSVTNLDNEVAPAGITVTSISGNTTEAGGTATFTAVLDRQPTADVILTFTSSNSAEGTVTSTRTFTAANWNTPQTITVTGVDDFVADGNIPYAIDTTASSTDLSYDNLTATPVNVTNLDNDTPGVTLTPTSGLITTEAGGTATFTAVLTSQPTANVTLTFTNSTPTEGTVTTNVTFTPTNWNTAQTITVTGVDDAIADGNIPYTITTTTSSSDPNYNNRAVPVVNVINNDNDIPGVTLTPTSGLVTTEASGTATFTAVLNSQPTADVTLTFASTNTAEGTVLSNITFTPTNWNSAQTVTITGVDDSFDDGDVSYSINTTTSSTDPNYQNRTVPTVSVTNLDNDTAGVIFTPTSGNTTEAGGTATYDIVLTSRPTDDVTFTFTSSNPSEGTVTTTLVFTSANWNVSQTVTVTGVDDAIADGNRPYTITTTTSSLDSSYNALIIPPVNLTNLDNDTAGITFTSISGNTTEAGGTATFTAVLTSQPTDDVTLTFTSSDLSEGTVTNTLTFTSTNWNTPQTVTVTGVDDAGVDGNIPYLINTTTTSTDGNYNNRIIPAVNVTNNDNDTPGVTLTPTSGLTTTESSGTATFTAVLTSQPTADVTLIFTSSDLSEGTLPATVTFTPDNWNTLQTITITGINDAAIDGNIPYAITTTTTSSDGNYNAIALPLINVTNLDNDTAGIILSPLSGLTTTELGGTSTFTAVLTSQPVADVTLSFSSSNSSEGTVTSSVTFTAANWNTPQTVTITGVNDFLDDGDVPYTINTTISTSDINYSPLTVAPVSVTNLDNDTAGITFTPISGNTTEAGGTATFTAVLNSQPTADVTLTFTSSDTSEGSVTTSITFTAANWNIAQTVTVTGVDDAIIDGNIPYTITTAISSSDLSYSPLAIPPIPVTNVDNDTPGVVFTPISGNTTEAGGTATFTAVLTSQPTADVTLTFTSSDTSEGTVTTSVTFTSTNWNTAQTVTVTGVDDAIADGIIAYTVTPAITSGDSNYSTLTLSPINVTNTDNDSAGVTLTPIVGDTTEAGGTATFTAVLTSEPTADVTLTFASSDTGEGTVIPSITFTAANWTVPQTVTVTGVDDAIADGNIPYTITTTTSSTDPNYNNRTVPPVSVNNIDNDIVGVTLTPISGNTTEAGGTATFTAVLTSQPTADVTLTFTSSDSSEGSVTTSVTFTATNWNVPQTVTVTGVDDAIVDGNIPYTITTTVSSTDSGYNGFTVPPVSVTNVDNDAVGVTLTPVLGTTTEAGGTTTFTAVLTSQPTADVTLIFTSSDASEGTVTTSITFTAANWNVPQTVTVTGVDDAIADGNIPYTITTTTSSTDPNYNGLTLTPVPVTNTDNDSAGITLTPISGNTTEAGGTATFTAVLTSQPTADVTLTFTSSDTGEGVVTTSVTFTVANWDVPQTVTVTGVDDAIVDGNIPYSITTTTSSIDPN